MEGLSQQDVLLRYIKFNEKDHSNVDSLNKAITSFRRLAIKIDNLKPGIKSQYQLLNEIQINDIESSNSANFLQLEINEGTASFKPRRVIY